MREATAIGGATMAFHLERRPPSLEDQALLASLDERIQSWQAHVDAEERNVAAKLSTCRRADTRLRQAVEERDRAKAELDRLVAAREALA